MSKGNGVTSEAELPLPFLLRNRRRQRAARLASVTANMADTQSSNGARDASDARDARDAPPNTDNTLSASVESLLARIERSSGNVASRTARPPPHPSSPSPSTNDSLRRRLYHASAASASASTASTSSRRVKQPPLEQMDSQSSLEVHVDLAADTKRQQIAMVLDASTGINDDDYNDNDDNGYSDNDNDYTDNDDDYGSHYLSDPDDDTTSVDSFELEWEREVAQLKNHIRSLIPIVFRLIGSTLAVRFMLSTRWWRGYIGSGAR